MFGYLRSDQFMWFFLAQFLQRTLLHFIQALSILFGEG